MHGVATAVDSFVGFTLSCRSAACPSSASAQSAISGIVRDTSGAVLPGVTVEAGSPVLIEKTRTGGHRRPGPLHDRRPAARHLHRRLHPHRLQHLQARRDRAAGQLHHDRSTPTCASARWKRSMTVTGDAPVVDVQSTQRTQVLNRDMLDALPTARNYSGLAALMPGVRMSNTDVGGNQQMEQIYMTRPRLASDRHDAAGGRHADEQPDERRPGPGLLQRRGERRSHLSDERRRRRGVGRRRAHQHDSERRRQPRSAGRPSRAASTARGRATTSPTSSRRPRPESGDRVDHISDYNFAIGGPIKQDRLWFFATFRADRHERSRRQQLLQGWPSRHRGPVDLQHHGAPDLADDAEEQVHGVLRPLPEVQGARDGRRSPIPTRRRSRRD